MPESINWDAVAAIATAISTLVITVALVLAYLEIREIRKATYATAYKAAFDILQAEEIRSARRFVFRELKDKDLKEWTEDDTRTAEKVCYTYDGIGQMVRHGFLPKNSIVDSWGVSLRRSWDIVKPLVFSLRKEFNAPEVWDDFEWLAGEVPPNQKRLY